ncbi:hypothetical protein [Mucilaginibacter phyllosphaerae]|uniref:DUF8188 domain-containing protein n=1 Tax=Mucilaginibacter phyllosphaerae TaxID=1812349 RepID=A0A4Y8AII5_9SPHI|nr:hypothetical protein [Mucilaginibacter phyllosphaerae]MBB3968094.1 hypothetical protein [Mucilaginibacter phyllosphaerae]TEW68883.1 hypothetical protein E2R65_01605 [Mucilaginibacter phyllosphaerae]GGH01283.1 hypothetical protein GCM10007352_02950 [Mucilaginibacter phyllosphaerae]
MKKVILISAVSLIAVGLVGGRFLGRWIMNKTDNPDTSINRGQEVADSYIQNSDTLHLVLKKFKYASKYFEVKAKTNYFMDGNVAFIHQATIFFKDEVRQKFFTIYYFFNKPYFDQAYGVFADGNLNTDGENIIATVNKKELADASYGTAAKPIPIIYFDAPAVSNSFYSMVAGDATDKAAFHGSEAEFKKYMLHYNAWHYLSYVKSKADFHKMYSKGGN